MSRKDSKRDERVFTLELDTRSNVRDIALPYGSQRVVIEGTIGSLSRAAFVEDGVLELTGSSGVLRVDLSKEDLAKGIKRPRSQ